MKFVVAQILNADEEQPADWSTKQ